MKTQTVASGNGSSMLPPLLFGNALANEVSSAQDYGDQMARTLSSLCAFDTLGNEFRAKSYSVEINGLTLTANACTPVNVSIADTAAFNLLVPISGRCVSTFERRAYQWQAGESAIYIPAVGRGGYSTTRSVLTIRFEPGRLLETVRCMQGVDEQPALLLDQPRLLRLRYGETSHLTLVRRIGSMIDDLLAQPETLSLLNLDDTFYRWMGMLFLADSEQAEPVERTRLTLRRRQLSRVCEYAASRLEYGVTLTELEREAGMSRRNLQYAFKEHFGCTPVAWLRKQRLARARDHLLHAQADDTITGIALRFGFAKASLFSHYYQVEFGEMPSQTLASVRGVPRRKSVA